MLEVIVDRELSEDVTGGVKVPTVGSERKRDGVGWEEVGLTEPLHSISEDYYSACSESSLDKTSTRRFLDRRRQRNPLSADDDETFGVESCSPIVQTETLPSHIPHHQTAISPPT